MNRPLLLTHLSMVFVGLLAGSATVATRGIARHVPPLSLAVLRYGQGSIVLLLLVSLIARQRLRIARGDLPLFLAIGALWFAGFPLAFNLGLRFTEAARGALMLATVPLWTALIALVTGWERLTSRQYLGIGISLAGIGLTLAEHGLHWRGDGRSLLGDGIMLVGAILGGANGFLIRRAYRTHSPATVIPYAMLIGTLLLLPAALVEGLPAVTGGLRGTTLLTVGFLGIFGGALLWYLAGASLRLLTATQSAVYIYLNPLAATILGVLFLHEALTPLFLAGFALTLIGVLLVNLPPAVRLWRRAAPLAT